MNGGIALSKKLLGFSTFKNKNKNPSLVIFLNLDMLNK
jgi:hypothetical protein